MPAQDSAIQELSAVVAPLPSNEVARLEALRQYNVLDTEPEAAFDDLTRLAARICQVPIALVSLVDAERQWFKSRVGLAATETCRDVAFCAHVILQDKLFLVPDATKDERFANNPLVASNPNIRFYAGVPLITSEGFALGTLCVIDYVPRQLSIEQQEILITLGHQVTTQLQLRRQSAILLERSRLSEMSAAVGVSLSHGGNLSDILNQCTESLVQHLEATFARLWILNQETKLLELQAIAGEHTHTDEFPSRISLGISMIGFIAQNHTPYFTNDVANDICIAAKDWVQQEQITAFAGYPLIVEERLVGVLALFGRRPLTTAVHDTLGWIANNIAIAVDRTWAREELLNRREALLFRLASQIRDSLNLNVILETAVNEIRSLLRIDRCHFLWYLPQFDQPNFVITHEARNPKLPSLLGDCPAYQTATLTEVILNLKVVRINNVNHDINHETEAQILTDLEATSQLLLPLETHSGQLGAIVCSHCSGSHPWSESEVELLQAVVDQLAIAIDQSELYTQTRAAAFAAETQAKQLSETLHDLQHTQSQLIQTEKMSSLGQMVAGIAHEINNPVNFINGNLIYASDYIQDLLKLLALYQQFYPNPVPEIETQAKSVDIEFLSHDLPKLLTSMKIGADRIRQIVLSLRNFSRLDEAEMKPVNIHEGIDNTLLILQNRLRTNNSEIEVVKQYGDLPLVACYAGQLNQVFMNILSNAIEALEEQPGRRTITIQTEVLHKGIVSLAPSSEPNQPLQIDDHLHSAPQNLTCSQPANLKNVELAIIRIRDNGPGMEAKVKDRLFDPFFTTKPVGKGTGLGLSISYQIVVDKHGGTLKCCSEPGDGAEFIIQIPLVQLKPVGLH